MFTGLQLKSIQSNLGSSSVGVRQSQAKVTWVQMELFARISRKPTYE